MPEERAGAVRLAETFAALGLVLLRTLSGVIDPWWTQYPWWADWILPVAALWLFHANTRPGRPRIASSHLLMALLALIYLSRQGVHVVHAYGLGSP